MIGDRACRARTYSCGNLERHQDSLCVSSSSRRISLADCRFAAFTRTITSLYVLTLLTLQTHIQLNLLGRSTYVTSVVSSVGAGLSADPTSTIQVENDDETDLENGLKEHKIVRAGEISKETERMYLTFSWWLLHEGWKEVSARVKIAVEEVVGPCVPLSRCVVTETDSILAEWRSSRRLRMEICLGSCRRFEQRWIWWTTELSTSEQPYNMSIRLVC